MAHVRIGHFSDLAYHIDSIVHHKLRKRPQEPKPTYILSFSISNIGSVILFLVRGLFSLIYIKPVALLRQTVQKPRNHNHCIITMEVCILVVLPHFIWQHVYVSGLSGYTLLLCFRIQDTHSFSLIYSVYTFMYLSST